MAKIKLKLKKYATGGVVTGDSLSQVKRVNTVEDNTNYTQDYAMKAATAASPLMAAGPVGIAAVGVATVGGAVAGAIKEKNAKKQNAKLKQEADTQQLAINKAWNADSNALATQTNAENLEEYKQRLAYGGGKVGMSGQMFKKGGKIGKVYKAPIGIKYLSNTPQLGVGQVSQEQMGKYDFKSNPVNKIGATQKEMANYDFKSNPSSTPSPKSSFGNVGAAGWGQVAMGAVDFIQDYSQNPKGTGYNYIAKEGMKLNKVKMQGGGVVPMSSDTGEIEGASHEQGGVDMSEMANAPDDTKVEAEGGETVKNTPEEMMIFSDTLKVPGTNKTFAQLHKGIATKKGKLEKAISKYNEGKGANNKNAVGAISNKLGMLSQQEEGLFQVQQMMNGDHSNEGEQMEMRKGGKVIKAEGGYFDNKSLGIDEVEDYSNPYNETNAKDLILPQYSNSSGLSQFGNKGGIYMPENNISKVKNKKVKENIPQENNKERSGKKLNLSKLKDWSSKESTREGISKAGNAIGQAGKYLSMNKNVNDNFKARKQAVDTIANLTIPQKARLSHLNFATPDYTATKTYAEQQNQNMNNVVRQNTSGNQTGIALAGLYGAGLDQVAKINQEQQNARVETANKQKEYNQGIDRENIANSYMSNVMDLERNRDVANDRANLVTDRTKERNEYITDTLRKESYADKDLAYQYAGLDSTGQKYLKSLGLDPSHYNKSGNNLSTALSSFKKGGKVMKNNCGGKLVKARFGVKFGKDCNC